jgi:hypothetical protein
MQPQLSADKTDLEKKRKPGFLFFQEIDFDLSRPSDFQKSAEP